ncbi:MAG TPA: hypothetical protein VMV38_01835 [Candidatus Paceibacterota bacterium]|nr:hypothetical protein [Candidatus Paceibacterota bacterium]
MLARSLIGIVLFLFVSYGLVKAWPLIAGPTLSIQSPRDYAAYPDGIVTISGTANRIALLTLNGTQVLHDTDGSFSSTLTFPRGGSILTFVATDQFGRHITTTRSVFVPD